MIAYLKYLHGLFNAALMCFFFYQGGLGVSIRRARRSKAPLPLVAVRRHRKRGPVLVWLGGLGFLVGLALVLVDTGKILDYPLHLFVGLAIVLFLICTFFVSRRIKRPDSPFRTLHFVLGIAILLLYLFQSFLGLGILF